MEATQEGDGISRAEGAPWRRDATEGGLTSTTWCGRPVLRGPLEPEPRLALFALARVLEHLRRDEGADNQDRASGAAQPGAVVPQTHLTALCDGGVSRRAVGRSLVERAPHGLDRSAHEALINPRRRLDLRCQQEADKGGLGEQERGPGALTGSRYSHSARTVQGSSVGAVRASWREHEQLPVLERRERAR